MPVLQLYQPLLYERLISGTLDYKLSLSERGWNKAQETRATATFRSIDRSRANISIMNQSIPLPARVELETQGSIEFSESQLVESQLKAAQMNSRTFIHNNELR